MTRRTLWCGAMSKKKHLTALSTLCPEALVLQTRLSPHNSAGFRYNPPQHLTSGPPKCRPTCVRTRAQTGMRFVLQPVEGRSPIVGTASTSRTECSAPSKKNSSSSPPSSRRERAGEPAPSRHAKCWERLRFEQKLERGERKELQESGREDSANFHTTIVHERKGKKDGWYFSCS